MWEPHFPSRRLIFELENQIREKDKGACLISLIMNHLSDPRGLAALAVSHMRELGFITKLLQGRKCKNLYMLINVVGGDLRFPEFLVKRIRSMGIETFKVIVWDVAVSVGTLLALIADEILAPSWALFGTLDPLIPPPILTAKEATAVKELIEEVLAQSGEERITPRVLFLQNLTVSGTLYEYVVSIRALRYVEKIMENYVKPRIGEENYKRLMEMLLYDVNFHDEPFSAEELAPLVPYLKLIDKEGGDLSKAISKYFDAVMDEMVKSNLGIIVEDPTQRFNVPLAPQL